MVVHCHVWSFSPGGRAAFRNRLPPSLRSGTGDGGVGGERLEKDARGNPKSASSSVACRAVRARCGVRAVRGEGHAPRIGVFLIHLVRVRVLVVVVPLRRPRDGRVARRALPRQDVTSHVVRAHQSGFDGVSVLLERPRGGGGHRILMDVEHRRSRLHARLGHAGSGVVAARARVLRECFDRRTRLFENSEELF